MKLNEFFEKAFYINLDRRTDRREQFETEMKAVGLEGWVTRVPGIPYTKGAHLKPDCDQCDRHAACGTVHRSIIQSAKDNGLKNILIFEDDVTFYNEGPLSGIEVIEKSIDQLAQQSSWDVFHLSAFFTTNELTLVSPNLISTATCLTAHAYAINHTGYDYLLEYNPLTDCPFDGWMGQRPFIKKFVTYPLAIYQRDGDSDLDAFGKSSGIGPYIENYNKPAYGL
jgi:GR25 family glycosyltransferase involved in LPS biosynthesis